MSAKIKEACRRKRKVQTTISLSEPIFRKLQLLAAADGRSCSGFLNQHLKREYGMVAATI